MVQNGSLQRPQVPSSLVLVAKRFIQRLRRSVFPTEQEKMLDRWYADGGDYKLRFDYHLDENSLV